MMLPAPAAANSVLPLLKQHRVHFLKGISVMSSRSDLQTVSTVCDEAVQTAVNTPRLCDVGSLSTAEPHRRALPLGSLITLSFANFVPDGAKPLVCF